MSIEIKKRKYCEQLFASKFDNLEEMDKFLETYRPPKPNQEETNNLNKLIIISEIKPILKIKISLQIKVQDQMASQANSTKHLDKLTPIPFQSIPKILKWKV